ncbi:oxidized low-density lipoprotein receptor 1 [Oreochromis niloticus]|uniref:oxidized low-density lipoprotein receptor 1 n=1 Tax=Oreochromis niloticus TaxID=8128 RepID=UPI000DF2E0B6|nr:oxidized low-density lipoprotein receptor 1-like [Oreochromis niloticus]
MMSRPQKYIEGEAFDSQREKSNNALKLRVAVLVVCVLLVSALMVTYLLFELLKTKEMLRKIELERETFKIHVTERLPEIKPCNTVTPTCPLQPEIKIITQPCSTIKPTTTTSQPPEVNMNEPCYKCEDDWKEHGGNCYYFSTNSSSWNESRTVCKSKGGDLVKIDSEEEQNFLRKNVQQKMEIHDIPFWIGLTDLAEEGRWLWVDGSPLNESRSRNIRTVICDSALGSGGLSPDAVGSQHRSLCTALLEFGSGPVFIVWSTAVGFSLTIRTTSESSEGGEVLTSIEDIIWRWKEYFVDFLNPNDMPLLEEAESGEEGDNSPISRGKVTVSFVAGPMEGMSYSP